MIKDFLADHAHFERFIETTFDWIESVCEAATPVGDTDLTTCLDVDRHADMLVIESAVGTFVVSKHTATKQLWIASPVSGAHRCYYDAVSHQWRSEQEDAPAELILSRDMLPVYELIWPPMPSVVRNEA